MTAITIRAAATADSRRIAELFRIASDGVSDYIWEGMRQPGESLLDVGARRYARENTEFSWQNCRVAEEGGKVVAMVHAYPVGRQATPEQLDEVDPVLRPYAELELSGSLYISALAALPGHRGRGLGSALLAAARRRAQQRGLLVLSLICFEENERALALYRRHGFEPIDAREIVPHPLIHCTGRALLMAAPAA